MSTRSMAASIGLNVIGLDTAESVGAVKSFVLNEDASRIERIQVAGRKRHPVVAAWSDLESFGADAVMVKHADDPTETDDDRDIDVAKGDLDILGARILDTAGFERGSVADVNFDDESGEIVSVSAVDGVTFDSAAIASLGSYALIVAHRSPST